MLETLVTAKQLARRWGISHRTLETWRSRDRGPAFIKLGAHVVYRLRDIEAFEAAQRRLTSECPDPARLNAAACQSR